MVGKDCFEGEGDNYIGDFLDNCYENKVSSLMNCTLEGTTLSENSKRSATHQLKKHASARMCYLNQNLFLCWYARRFRVGRAIAP